jgi:integrase
VTEAAVVRYVASLRGPRSKGKISTKTANKYLNECKWFFSWLVRKARQASVNPLESLDLLPADGDERFKRRDLTKDECDRVLAAALASETRFRGLTGADRAMLYRVAASTGLRASALASLTPSSFRLDAPIPHAVVNAGKQKNRKRQDNPIKTALLADLRAYLAGRDPATPVWPGGWFDNAARCFAST